MSDVSWQRGDSVIVVDTKGHGRRYRITDVQDGALTVVPEVVADAFEMINVGRTFDQGEPRYLPGAKVGPIEQLMSEHDHL